MKNSKSGNYVSKLSIVGVLVTLGIVYGDIGTSPLYVMKAIISSGNQITADFIFGAISCVIWTLTFQTTFKYIFVTLRADNKGEGGIFALYTLVKRKIKWVFIIALIGGSALLADGVITPSITVVSAIEGLRILGNNIPIIPISLTIITFLFVIQRFGTGFLGKSFGPIMFLWFLVIGLLGINQIVTYPEVIKSFNPYYAYELLTQHPHGVLLLGAVFLCTTGAEALYSDLGHCGISNIRTSWFYVKAMLILNYLGQGAWIINNSLQLKEGVNPFFAIMPNWFLIPGIILATLAAIIASQALITGSYTIITEAIRLNFWPKVRIKYPTEIQGQMYVPSINWLLWAACCFVIIYFKESSNMEAAYGLSITITMLMTTILVSYYLALKKTPSYLIYLFLATYLTIEGVFLYSNLYKFPSGGWVTILLASIILFIMYFWYKGREIKHRFYVFKPIQNYFHIFEELNKDTNIPLYASNVVYITNSVDPKKLEEKILYSIINKQPKRADKYWFIHINISDEPYTREYDVINLYNNFVYRVDFFLGFKVDQRINLYFRQVIDEMRKNHEITLISGYTSLRKFDIAGDFKFVVINRIQNYDYDFKSFEQFTMDTYDILKEMGTSDIKSFGLDTSNVQIEKVPLITPKAESEELQRISKKVPN